jgi:cyclic pyranopterin phosphate synthase
MANKKPSSACELYLGLYMAELFLDGSKLIHHLPVVEKWKKGEKFFPIHAEISPTSGCNQRCNLCYVDYLGHKAGFLEESIMNSLADEFGKLGVKSVLLAGEGEPTANKGIVSMIQRAHRNGVDMAINSNAVLMTKEMSEAIMPQLTWARFTFQASNPALYQEIHKGHRTDYERATKNVQEAVRVKKDKKLNVTLGTQQILINENYRDVYETAKLSKELGVDYYVVKRFSKHPNNHYDVPEDLYLQSMDELKRAETLSDDKFKVIVRWNNFSDNDCTRGYKKCLGTPFITQILADGKIYPCSQFFKDPQFCYGDLHTQSFEEIFTGDRIQQVTKKIEEEINVKNCISYCRHHSTNQFLWKIHEQPAHVNFI